MTRFASVCCSAVTSWLRSMASTSRSSAGARLSRGLFARASASALSASAGSVVILPDRLPGGTPKGRELIPLFLLLIAIAATAVLWSHFEDSIVDVAFGPLGLIPDAAQDDGAGDALTPAAEADLYLPSVSALEDPRVV